MLICYAYFVQTSKLCFQLLHIDTKNVSLKNVISQSRMDLDSPIRLTECFLYLISICSTFNNFHHCPLTIFFMFIYFFFCVVRCCLAGSKHPQRWTMIRFFVTPPTSHHPPKLPMREITPVSIFLGHMLRKK